jgi:NAD(P)H-dependent FMN reductase
MNLLTVCGSLRADSVSARVLAAAGGLAPVGWDVRARRPLDELPFFQPDIEESSPPDAALALRAEIAWSEAILVSTPEYAHGVPGVLKNALDWLVGGVEIVGKPVGIFNATPPATYAGASLRETLRVMGAVVVEAASIDLALRGSRLDAAAIAAEPRFATPIRAALAGLREAAGRSDR